MEEKQRELQLLPTPNLSTTTSDSSTYRVVSDPIDPLSLDLQLSISFQQSPTPSHSNGNNNNIQETKTIEALKQHASEQIRLAAVEKAYADRVRDLTKREMEMAESEFARARHVWERAREEVEKVERLKEKAVRRIDSNCMEVTCQACRQRFRP
ncbi:hypothetical protein ACLOJK_008407 [Asimina triloba]